MTGGPGGGGRRPEVIGASVRGAVHERDGLRNEDALAWSEPHGADGRLVVAVSDGHGSRKAFRSHTGARLAVDLGVSAGEALLARPLPDGLYGLDEATWATLATEIVDRWTAAVGADLAARPLADDELAGVAVAEGDEARLAVEDDPVLAYGATLLLAVIDESATLLLQLGDGDILVVSGSGASVRPLPDDPRLLGNDTTSLCMPDARREFRCTCRPLARSEASVLLLATDGLGNAYPDDEAFMQVGADLLARICATGLSAVAGELDAYLREASTHSGDDVTVAVVWLGPATDDRPATSGDVGSWPAVTWPTTTW